MTFPAKIVIELEYFRAQTYDWYLFKGELSQVIVEVKK